MGDGEKALLRLKFNLNARLKFHGATITSDIRLLPVRGLDAVLCLSYIASDYLEESRIARNVRHHPVPMLRQSTYSRQAGYNNTRMPNVFLRIPVCEL